jgi:hypothetical protein
LFSLQDLELRLDLGSGSPLRGAKNGNQLGGKCQMTGGERQPLRFDLLTVIALY